MSDAVQRSGKKPMLARVGLHTWRGRFLWFFFGMFLAFATVWTLVRLTPSWYLPLDPSDNTVIDLSARAQNLLQFELKTAMERVPLGEQTWSITQDEANSLLAILTAAPIGEDGKRVPVDDRVSDPYVVFGPGTVTICARIRDLPGPTKQGGVGTLTFSVTTVEEDGKRMGQVKLIGANAGRIPVPVRWVEARLQATMPAMVKAVEKMIAVQLNASDVSAVEDALKRAGAGEKFPLEFRVSKKNVVVRDLRFEAGRFTVVLGPAGGVATQMVPVPSQGPVR